MTLQHELLCLALYRHHLSISHAGTRQWFGALFSCREPLLKHVHDRLAIAQYHIADSTTLCHSCIIPACTWVILLLRACLHSNSKIYRSATMLQIRCALGGCTRSFSQKEMSTPDLSLPFNYCMDRGRWMAAPCIGVTSITLMNTQTCPRVTGDYAHAVR